MSEMQQLPLFPLESLVEKVDRRLPRSDFVNATDVALACHVNKNKVYAWIEEGHIEAVNSSPGKQPSYQISRESVICFYRRRQVGAV